MKIVVTGGAGFIGLHLVNHLLKEENQITILDNFSNSDKNLTKILQHKNLKIIEGDIRKIDDMNNCLKEQDIVIHLAAKISVSQSILNPSETFEVNVDGTKNVLEACKKNNIKKIIIASSAAVYGEGMYGMKLKENTKTDPVSPYGKSKLIMEQEIEKNILKYNKLDCVILRFFNIFGVGQTSEYAGVITKFVKRKNCSKETNESRERYI